MTECTGPRQGVSVNSDTNTEILILSRSKNGKTFFFISWMMVVYGPACAHLNYSIGYLLPPISTVFSDLVIFHIGLRIFTKMPTGVIYPAFLQNWHLNILKHPQQENIKLKRKTLKYENVVLVRNYNQIRLNICLS